MRRAKELELTTGTSVFQPTQPFDSHLTEYLAWHADTYPHSHFRVKQIAADAFADFRGMSLGDITRQSVDEWLRRRRARVGRNRHGQEARVSAETAGKEFRTLRAVLQRAVALDKLAKNPASGVRQPKSMNSAPPIWYTQEELQRLYRRPLGRVWRLLANTGLRRAEALALRWRDVHENALHVVSSEAMRTKSGHWRPIPLTQGARLALATLAPFVGAPRPDAWVLPHMTGSSLTRAFLADVKAVGLTGSPHSLRHSYATHLIRAEVPMRAVQKLLGHASYATTEIYASVGDDALAAFSGDIDI